MKKREDMAPGILGGSSLLVIFGVLCLMMLALLSVSTVLAEKRLSEASARAVQEYYSADLMAEAEYARLRQSVTEPGIYAFSFPISDDQTLFVEVEKTEIQWKVNRWQAVAHPGRPSETIPVWQGTQ